MASKTEKCHQWRDCISGEYTFETKAILLKYVIFGLLMWQRSVKFVNEVCMNDSLQLWHVDMLYVSNSLGNRSTEGSFVTQNEQPRLRIWWDLRSGHLPMFKSFDGLNNQALPKYQISKGFSPSHWIGLR